MNPQNLDTLLENQSLKNEFKIRGLDVTRVWYPSPEDLELENRQLRRLLEWVEQYRIHQSREKMEARGYLYPPIEPDADPDSDWYRFKRWLLGLPVRKKIKDQLSQHFQFKDPGTLTDEKLPAELEKLLDELAGIHIDLIYNEGVPQRLVYEYLAGCLEDEVDLLGEGWWHNYGCDGFCPGCFQRPWCDMGGNGCWLEDDDAGKMYLIKMVQKFVSATPLSLEILRARQVEEDRTMDKFDAPEWDKNNQNQDLPF
ncbi:MAG: hypothetical protein ACT6FF_08270 [Methanosarcinaceae archaeon]